MEVRRTQINKLGWPEHLADHWQREVTASFPEALVTGYEPLLEQCQNDVEDRHVLAAAIRAPASTIVTYNLRHFPPSALEPHTIIAQHPADYLCTLYDADPDLVRSRIRDIAERRKMELLEVLRRLKGPLPRFADHVASSHGWTL